MVQGPRLGGKAHNVQEQDVKNALGRLIITRETEHNKSFFKAMKKRNKTVNVQMD